MEKTWGSLLLLSLQGVQLFRGDHGETVADRIMTSRGPADVYCSYYSLSDSCVEVVCW